MVSAPWRERAGEISLVAKLKNSWGSQDRLLTLCKERDAGKLSVTMRGKGRLEFRDY